MKTKSTYKFLQVLKKAEQKINRIKGEPTDIQGRQRNENLQQKYDRSSHVHPPEKIPINTTTMVGFDEYSETIKDQLSGHPLQRQVISIVGTGGIGKTTLAKNTFDDALIVEHFDCRVWITVSQEYNAQQVLQILMKSLRVGKSREGEERELIFKHLKGRRYLIVLDDIWDIKVWDEVMHIFPKDDDNGSRIVLTTRLLNIAEYAGTFSEFIHQIPFLNEDDSWNLFQRNVFFQNDCPPELEDIGKSIVSKCGGLPLAIVVIAGVLSSDKTPFSWKEIETNLSAILSRTDKHISNMLSFSYNHLPYQLKACFLYMGIFPEDYRINVSNLIKLWVAKGFLKSANGPQTLEEVGEKCLEDLVGRNLVIITERRWNGQYEFCVLHDLLRDLCRERAVDECFFHVSCDGRNGFNPHRISFYCGHPFEADDNVVHSVHHFRKESNSDFVTTRMDILKRLRVLNAPEADLEDLGIIISRMIRLKFLKVDYYGIKDPPPRIFRSHNLQTIIITYGYTSIPSEIWKMSQLRHIIIDSLALPPISAVDDDVPIQKLEYLQTLMTLRDFRFTKEVIEMIPNLRILKTKHVSDESHHLENLVDLHCLEKLEIEYYLDDHNLALSSGFPQNLKELSLKGCELPWKRMTMVGSLQNLQVLEVLKHAFVGDVWEPIEGEFQSLKYLRLYWLHLKWWKAEASHFPCLERLIIIDCNYLKEIPLAIGDIATLKDIRVSFCSDNVRYSAIRIQEEQQELGNDALQVKVENCGWLE